MSWLEGFEPFSLHHLAVVGVFAVLTATTVIVARRLRGTRRELAIRLAWGYTALLAEIGSTVVWFQPGRYSRDDGWPIHLCDLAAWLTPYALVTTRRWPKTVLFFWALGLSTQGFVTPTVPDGIASVAYWVFWLQHIGVVGAGVYLAAVDGYRPRLADLGLACLVTLGTMAVMVVVNLAAGTNYMYVGNELPARRTVIDALGPWPLRLVWLALLGTFAFVLTWAITDAAFAVFGRTGPRGPSEPPASRPDARPERGPRFN